MCTRHMRATSRHESITIMGWQWDGDKGAREMADKADYVCVISNKTEFKFYGETIILGNPTRRRQRRPKRMPERRAEYEVK